MRSVGEHELKDSLLKSDFDYIALGHFHGQAQLSGNAWYSGSVEYFNFGEAQDEKGMLLVDLETGRAESVPVKPKYMIDHPAIDCSGMRSEEIAECLLELCHEDEIRDQNGAHHSEERQPGRLQEHRSGKAQPAGSLCPLLQDPAGVSG